eukprot:4255204-Pleurochrysis_carterae.AAC.1
MRALDSEGTVAIGSQRSCGRGQAAKNAAVVQKFALYTFTYISPIELIKAAQSISEPADSNEGLL